MKKLFTLLLVAASALAARATDYTVPMVITVNGVSTEQTSLISITENGGLYDFNLKNFMLQSADGPMGVGNVELKGIEPVKDGDATLLLTDAQVTITRGDDPNVQVWMADMLPPVNVVLTGKIVGDHVRCYIDIDLTKSLGQTIQVEIGEGYQLANRSFENWHTTSGEYVEPNAWHSFESASGSLAALAGHHISKSADAHTGEASARIFSTSIFGIIANGTMTTGRMNAGSISASDPANHAYLDMSSADKDGNGDPFYSPMYSRPDSIALWVKFKQGTANAAHPYATVSAVITDGTRYQDPEDKAYTNVVAKAKNNQIAVTGDEWVRVAAPFEYTDNSVEPKAVLVTISTNADPGQGSDGDEVLVDDISFIYNTDVTDIKVNGESVEDFSSDDLIYYIDVDEAVTADDIEVDTESPTAHVVKSVEYDETSCIYTIGIVVVSADLEVKKAYIIYAENTTATAIRNIAPVADQTPSYYTLDGIKVQTPEAGKIYICRKADGTVAKLLKK